MKKFEAFYSIFIGMCMICMWCFLLFTKNVAEVKTEPINIAFHLFAEFSTALILLVSGIGILTKRLWADKLFILSIGALMYSVINAAGYYLQYGEISMFVMFTVIFVFATIFTILRLKNSKS